MSRQNVLAFNVYKNTLRRAEGFQPVSGGRGYSKIVCRFRSDDWAAENDELSAGFFVTPRNVIGVTGTVVANTDENAPEHAQLLAEFAIPTEILRQRLPFYVGIAGVYDEGDVVIATNTVRVDTAKGIVVDELSGNEEIMSNYEVLMGTLNGKAAKTYVDAQDAALEQRVSSLESGKADAATTIAGYGITDAYTKAETDTALGDKANAADVYTKTDADDKFFTKTAANRKTNEADFVAFKHDVENRFELHLTVGFDENGVPVKWGDKGTYSGGDFADNRIVTAFVSSKVTRLFSGAFASCTNLTDIYIDKASGELTIDPGAIPSGATVYYKGEFNAVDLIIKALKWFETGKADKATTLAGYGITDAYTKAQADQVTDKNRAEVLGGNIVPQMERGYISSQNGGEYWGDNRFVRTKEGYDMWLNPGAVIGLTDYTDARLTVKYIPAGDSLKETPQPLASDFTVTQFGLYRFLITKAPVNGVLQQLTDAEVERLKGLVRVTNPTVYGMTEADAPAPLILGRSSSDATYVDITAANGAVTMTIPGNSGIVTTNGIIHLGSNRLTVNCVQNGYERVKVVYDKSSGTVKAVPHNDNAFSYILIAAVCCYLDTSLAYYRVPAEVHINAPYRINNRCMGLPFSEVLTPVSVGYDPGAKRNYVSVDTTNKTIIFPAGTLIFAGEAGGFVNLNNGAQCILDYSSIPLGSGSYYGVMKLYFNVNSKQLFIAPRNSIMYGAYPLVAVIHVPQNAGDKAKPSISINAPAVIDHLPDGFDNPLRTKNSLIKQIGHRGYNTVAPENTLPAFRLARKMGFDYVETDIQRVVDDNDDTKNRYICFHDDSITDRVAQNTGNLELPTSIAGKTLSQVKAYDVGRVKEEVSSRYQGTTIPTLEELLDLCRSIGLKIYLELKTETLSDGILGENRQQYVQEIITIVKTYGMIDKVAWVSLSNDLLTDVKTICPTATLVYAVEAVNTNSMTNAVALKNGTNKVILSVNIANCQKTTNNINRIVELCARDDIPMGAWFASNDSAAYIKNAHPYVSEFTCNELLAGNILYDDAIG